MKNVVVPQIKPHLIRKKTVVKSTPTVKVALPQERKLIRLEDLQQQAASPRPIISQSKAVKQPSSRIKKKPTVQYRTHEPMPGSPAKIRAIQASGRGKILVIVANGPSINEVPLDKLVGIPRLETMSINSPDPRIWPTTHWAFFDLSQYRRHEKLWVNYEGYMFNSVSIRQQKNKSMQFRNKAGHGWSRNLVENIFIGRSSVYAAMQIAQWMSFDHTYIFGVDMNPKGLDGKLHFYGINPDVEPKLRAQRFEAESKFYEHAAEVLTEVERSKFTFCSRGINPWPFIDKFQSCTHQEAVDIILAHAAKLDDGK